MYRAKDLLDNLSVASAADSCAAGENQTVGKHGNCGALDIVGGDVIAVVDGGISLCRLLKRNASAGACAELDRVGGAGRLDDACDILNQVVVDVYLRHLRDGGVDVLDVCNRRKGGKRVALSEALENGDGFFLCWLIH